jgi:hypothetical protein
VSGNLHHHQPAVMGKKKRKNRNRPALTTKDAKENRIKIIDYAATFIPVCTASSIPISNL